jgi:hypothetical protein
VREAKFASEDLVGAKVSKGWLSALQAEAAGQLTPFLAWLKGRLVEEPSSTRTRPARRPGRQSTGVQALAFVKVVAIFLR